MSENVPGLPGVTLERNSLGALVVHRNGANLGWMHDQHNGKWRAYRPLDGVNGELLGTFTRDDAIRAIVDRAPPPIG